MTLSKVLNIDTINPRVNEVEYAVRGQLSIRAEEISQEIQSGSTKYPFTNVIYCNIGNPQQLNQPPITFFRQVASLCENPILLKQEYAALVSQLYPADAIQRAQTLLDAIGGSIGAYSHLQGVPHIRQTVAKFMEARDGHAANPSHIYLTQGASPGVQTLLNILIKNEKTGVMIPIPQYPLYSATLTLYGATPVPYYLEESTGWSLDTKGLVKSVKEARKNGIDVKALVIINPGNPTGQCLSVKNMREILLFCYEERLLLLADEVYQVNCYDPEVYPFTSFKKVLMDYTDNLELQQTIELVSFHSISKGLIGECGRRGGYFECVNLDNHVMEQIYKMASVAICPNVHGQIMVDLMCDPPQKGQISYDLYHSEITSIYNSLKRRSKKLETVFNRMEGVSCQPAQGAMFLFPRIEFPKEVLEAAKKQGEVADTYYALAMLESTGVCVVPGSGFGQKEGTWHFRSTFLPEEHLFDQFCKNLEEFHKNFLEKHRKSIV